MAAVASFFITFWPPVITRSGGVSTKCLGLVSTTASGVIKTVIEPVGFEIVINTLEFASLSPRSRNTSPNEEPPKGSIAWPFGGNCFIVSSLSLGLELTG